MHPLLRNFIEYNNLDIKIADEISCIFGEMVGALAWGLISGVEDTSEKFDPIKEKFSNIVSEYELDEETYDELKNILVTTYYEFAKNIIAQQKEHNGEETKLEAALSKLHF